MAKPDEITKVQAVFNPSETDHIVRALDMAIQSGKRAQNSKLVTPEFRPIHERIIAELEAIKVKIRGLVN